MIIQIAQDEVGTVSNIAFIREAETKAAFRTAIRNWMTAHYPAMTMQEIFSRIEQLTPDRIDLNMV